MIEYQKHLEEYKSEYYLTYTQLTEKEWGNEELAKNYLEKYWLNEDEYKKKWKEIQNAIFDINFKFIPDNIFLKDFALIPISGGTIFSKDDFEVLKECMKETGDNYFVIIQNNSEQDIPVFRMKYPSTISWNELMSGNYISTVLFEMFHNEYFIFGESSLWGKYVANDEFPPLDIIGVKKKFDSIFINKFKDLRKDEQEAIDSLLDSYKINYTIY